MYLDVFYRINCKLRYYYFLSPFFRIYLVFNSHWDLRITSRDHISKSIDPFNDDGEEDEQLEPVVFIFSFVKIINQ